MASLDSTPERETRLMLGTIRRQSANSDQQTYVRVDNDLWHAKLAYSVEYGRIFCEIYPDNVAAGMEFFRVDTTRYLAHVSHLVGCNWSMKAYVNVDGTESESRIFVRLEHYLHIYTCRL